MYKYVFLDLDDTIWDFHANAKMSLKKTFEDMELTYLADFEDFFKIYAKKNAELWEQYGKNEITKDHLIAERFRYPLERIGIEDDVLRKSLGDTYLSLLPTRTALVPYAGELLEYLSKKYLLSIISNGFVEVQYEKLKNTNITHFFAHIVLSENAGVLKPDKRIFEYALKLNNAKKEEAIMIGDNYEADIKGAMNAGIDQIFLNHRAKIFEGEKSPTYSVDSLKAVFDIL